jgi:hypothetical protein
MSGKSSWVVHSSGATRAIVEASQLTLDERRSHLIANEFAN